MSAKMARVAANHLFEEEARPQGPVDCLGMTFESNEARRAYFLEKLREKLRDPEFRKIEGFPMGEDDDILALSDPPYYTACPNPFIQDFVRCYGKPYDPEHDDYHREPFAADVSEGKNDPIYGAHSYHTKVPHKAIMRYILHYTDPGDVVFDGFCGSGMVGVAANQLARRAILCDLSPAATFMAHVYCHPFDLDEAERASSGLIGALDDRIGWLYRETPSQKVGANASGREIDYIIWSEVFFCPNCSQDFAFADVGFNFATRRPKEDIFCPSCHAGMDIRSLPRALDHMGKTREVPVHVSYIGRGGQRESRPGADFFRLLGEVERHSITCWYPSNQMMNHPRCADGWGDMWRRGYHRGYDTVSDFFYKRTLSILAASVHTIRQCDASTRVSHFMLQSVVNLAVSASKMRRAYQGILPLVLYIPKLKREVNVIRLLESKMSQLTKTRRLYAATDDIQVTTQSTTHIESIPDECIDYIFTDPPFGDNILYAEVNHIWESWLRVFTNQKSEAVISSSQHKRLREYQELMQACFRQMYRILKPGRWITVEFHNSRNSVWNAIQEALQEAGLVVADVRTLDKQQVSFKQASTARAVRQDLVISAYRPTSTLEHQLEVAAGTVEGAWDFVHSHLRQVPVFVELDGKADIVAERQNFLLYDRMVAFHLRRWLSVPMSASDFYAGVRQRFPERDGMYFLPDQVVEYDQKRMAVRGVVQLEIAPTDEQSAILWLRADLEQEPQTFQELQPKFMRAVAGWQKHERPLELSSLLEQNFLPCEGSGSIPEQIWTWMLRQPGLRERMKGQDREAPGPSLRAEARNRWYVPDPNKAGDLEQMREKALLKEFEQYRASPQRQLKVFRMEAVRAGFKAAWTARDYATILAVARKIPEQVLQEDPKLLMWYDQAVTRTGET